MSELVKIGITIGDTNGIGPEVVIKALADERLLKFFTPVIYAHSKVLAYYKKACRVNDFSWHMCESAAEAEDGRVNVVNCWDEEVKIDLGEENETGGKYAFKSLSSAAADLKEGILDAMVTAPINKNNIQSAEFSFPGHTEYLQQLDESESVLMFMVSENLRVAVATGHIPLSAVSESLTKAAIVNKLKVLNKTLQNDFWIEKPIIAVLGLNPHASDNGLMGNEEELIISPAIQEAFDRGIMCFGPYAADGFFGSGTYRKFDAVLAMYHDQGLIPFKALSFGNGVNFTAGLSFVRTSPDHGTAYDIADKGVANEASFINALFMAAEIYKNRAEQKRLLANQLRPAGKLVEAAGDVKDDEQ